jgi:type III restriction enzyme
MLINWIDRTLPLAARRDITKVSSTLFISKALDLVMSRLDMTLEAVARAKFRVVDALVKVIAAHRDERERTAYEQALMFPQSGLEFETSGDHALIFDENFYAYNQPYSGATVLQKHFARVIGDLEARGEEHDCAVHIDRLEEVKVWARNTVRQTNSFWLHVQRQVLSGLRLQTSRRPRACRRIQGSHAGAQPGRATEKVHWRVMGGTIARAVPVRLGGK